MYRIAITRSLAQASSMSTLIRKHHAEPVLIPLIQTAPPKDLDAFQLATKDEYDWAVYTSVNSVDAVATYAQQFPILAKVAAVGPKTAQALHSHGQHVDLLAPEHDFSARGLLEVIPAGTGRIFYPHADIAAPTLSEGLRAKGWDVVEVVAYRTVPYLPSEKIVTEVQKGTLDAVTFTSSSTVTNFVKTLGIPPAGTLIACIGPATAQTALKLGLWVDVVAHKATVEALVDDVIEALEERKRL